MAATQVALTCTQNAHAWQAHVARSLLPEHGSRAEGIRHKQRDPQTVLGWTLGTASSLSGHHVRFPEAFKKPLFLQVPRDPKSLTNPLSTASFLLTTMG